MVYHPSTVGALLKLIHTALRDCATAIENGPRRDRTNLEPDHVARDRCLSIAKESEELFLLLQGLAPGLGNEKDADAMKSLRSILNWVRAFHAEIKKTSETLRIKKIGHPWYSERLVSDERHKGLISVSYFEAGLMAALDRLTSPGAERSLEELPPTNINNAQVLAAGRRFNSRVAESSPVGLCFASVWLRTDPSIYTAQGWDVGMYRHVGKWMSNEEDQFFKCRFCLGEMTWEGIGKTRPPVVSDGEHYWGTYVKKPPGSRTKVRVVVAHKVIESHLPVRKGEAECRLRCPFPESNVHKDDEFVEVFPNVQALQDHLAEHVKKSGCCTVM